ncbi:MAG: efflux RND transporter periplasmic adaptor subunit [Gemmatimonadota bacterium]
MELRNAFRALRQARGPLGALAPLVIASACHAGSAQEPVVQQAAVSVGTAPVERRTLERPIVATGTYGPKDAVALSFKVGGVIASIAVDEGARVAAGQVLARLEQREVEAGLQKARGVLTKAERDLERARRLYEDSVATLSQLQDAETAAQIARADVDAAEFNRRYATIVAPAGGGVLRRDAEAGETVSPGTVVLTLGSAQRGAVVRVGLADRDVLRVERGDSATITFSALPGRKFTGRVTEVAGAATPGTGTFAVEVTLDGAPRLVAGMVGRVSIRPAEALVRDVVPLEAVLEADGHSAAVFTLSADGQRAERRTVTVGFIDGAHVAIDGGLDGVRTVITEGASWLSDGALVRVSR